MVARGGGRQWLKWVKGIKRYNLPVIKSPVNVMYSTATVVNNTRLYFESC